MDTVQDVVQRRRVTLGDEDISDKLDDRDYLNALFCIDIINKLAIKSDEYEISQELSESWKRISDDYIDFRLKHYDSEGRKVIRATYKTLGYKPNRGKNGL